MNNVRLYQSCQNDVIYVYGYPVKFDKTPEVVAKREADKASKIAAQRIAK